MKTIPARSSVHKKKDMRLNDSFHKKIKLRGPCSAISQCYVTNVTRIFKNYISSLINCLLLIH